jgi:hypothetical protein
LGHAIANATDKNMASDKTLKMLRL